MNQPFSIERPVGERETNRSDDLETVRNVLAERGLCQRTVTGQRNAKFKPDLTAGIRIFQRKAGLHPDGLVVPGGPTALALALGGDIAGAAADHAFVEDKQADQADCIRMRQQIARTNRGIDVANDRIDKADATRREAETNRDRVIDRIKRLATKLGLNVFPRIGNLNDVIGELYELPAASRSDVQTVVNLIDEALTLDSARKEAEADVKKLLKIHSDLLEVLKELQAAYDAQCPVA